MLYSYKESISKYGSKYMLKKAVESGEFFRQDDGIYSDEKYVSEKYVIAAKYPKAIYTLDSAFYHYGLTDVIPEKYYLATNRDAAKIGDDRVVQVFERRDLLSLGVITIGHDGCNISIYNRERMLVELLRHKSKLPFDYYKEVLLNYREIIDDLDIRLVQDYVYEVPKSAKIMETLQMEVL